MKLRLKGGRVVDPANSGTSLVRDIVVHDGRIVPEEAADGTEDTYNVDGHVVMAGGIDLHSHIAGGKVNLARMLMHEDRRAHPEPPGPLCGCGGGHAVPTAHATGCRYAEMGYTAVFEPAVVATNARQMHLEMSDIPLLDTGGYLVLGNDDLLLEMLAEGADRQAIRDYVGWMLEATQCMAIKVVNPGGINAFKFNGRRLDLDEAGPHYALTPRRILTALIGAVTDLGLAHPIHLHGCNLGVPGNVETTLDTIGAAEGLPLHLTHVQFHAYGTEGERRFSSGAARIAEAVNANPNISIDVGQVMFGQTVTASADLMSQYRNRGIADPKRWIGMDIECDSACGVVPFRYRDKSFVNALQWAIGLELFLLVEDPWRIFLTTDHPNGAPFSTYPHLIRLLMDKAFRDAEMEKLHPAVRAHTNLASIRREYTLEEIAIITRAAPARIHGLSDRGHLGPGAVADIVVYPDNGDREAMFSRARWLFKAGRPVVRDGEVIDLVEGQTIVARPGFDRHIEGRIVRHFDERIGLKAAHFRIADEEIRDGAGPLIAGRG